MSDTKQTQEILKQLNNLVNRHYYSVVAYLSECHPWIPNDKLEAMSDMLDSIDREEKEISEHFANEVSELGGVVLLGNYTMADVDLSYLSLSYSVDFAIKDKTETLSQIQKLLATPGISHELKHVLLKAEERGENHLAKLKTAKQDFTPKPKKEETSAE